MATIKYSLGAYFLPIMDKLFSGSSNLAKTVILLGFVILVFSVAAIIALYIAKAIISQRASGGTYIKFYPSYDRSVTSRVGANQTARSVQNVATFEIAPGIAFGERAGSSSDSAAAVSYSYGQSHYYDQSGTEVPRTNLSATLMALKNLIMTVKLSEAELNAEEKTLGECRANIRSQEDMKAIITARYAIETSDKAAASLRSQQKNVEASIISLKEISTKTEESIAVIKARLEQEIAQTKAFIISNGIIREDILAVEEIVKAELDDRSSPAKATRSEDTLALSVFAQDRNYETDRARYDYLAEVAASVNSADADRKLKIDLLRAEAERADLYSCIMGSAAKAAVFRAQHASKEEVNVLSTEARESIIRANEARRIAATLYDYMAKAQESAKPTKE